MSSRLFEDETAELLAKMNKLQKFPFPPKQTTKHCKIQLYTDDTLLYVSSSSISDIESMLSEDLKHVIGLP